MKHSIHERWLEGRYGLTRYWESEPAQGPPLLLIHGYGAMIEHWRAVMRPIAAQHHMLALDLHYFGQSSIPDEPPDRQLWAAQAAELLAVVARRPAIVVGHSMGGIAAAQLAHDYPELVRGLVLVNSVGLEDPSRRRGPFDQLFFQLAATEGVGELIAGMAANPWAARQGLLNAYYDKSKVTDELVEQFTRPLRRRGGARAYLSVTRSFPRLFLDLAPGAIRQPALLIWGEQDRSVPLSLAELFRTRLLPQAELRSIPDSGHCPFDETPEAFVQALLPWTTHLGGG